MEAVAILQMTRSYVQADNIPIEQYLEFQEILISLKNREGVPSAVLAVSETLLSICPHGQAKAKGCKHCLHEALSSV